MTKLGKRASKNLFQTLFHGYSFKQGDFVRFKYGRLIYRINDIDETWITLFSVPSFNNYGFSKLRGFEIKEVSSRLEKVPRRVVFYFLCLKKPDELVHFFDSEKERMRLFKRYLKPIKRRTNT